MKTKVCILLSLMFIVGHSAVKAEITILSPEVWSPDISDKWYNYKGLSFSSTAWGETYYNADWQDMSKPQTIEYKPVQQNFYFTPPYNREWEFRLPITNLNAEKGYSYYDSSNPKKKQSFDQIYWGFYICMWIDGDFKKVPIWIKRGNREYWPGTGEETYSSGRKIEYKVGEGAWQESSYPEYPSCQPSAAPLLKIIAQGMHGFKTWHNKNYWVRKLTPCGIAIYWGELKLTEIPGKLESISLIRVYVGTQAKVQIGTPTVYSRSVDTRFCYAAQDLMEQGNFIAAKQQLYNADGKYYEIEAINLALCYASLEEYDDCIEMCNALIKYQGEYQSTAYSVRGLVLERKGQKTEALEDYKKANDSEHYNRLYNEIYNSKAAQSTQQTPTQKTTNQQNTKKPPLSK